LGGVRALVVVILLHSFRSGNELVNYEL